METELIIEGCNFPPLSARGCSQELSIVDQGSFRRSVNGDLVYLGPSTHKYKSVITCEDKVTLVNEGILVRGMVVRIGCLQRLWQQGILGKITLERPYVAGSIVAMDSSQRSVEIVLIDPNTIEISHQVVENEPIFISYRPWLSMRVVALKLYTNEWGLKAGWQLELEEI